MINNAAYNLSTGNKWIAVIPFKQVDPTLTGNDMALNLTNFSFPELEQSVVTFSIRGREVPLPTGVKNESKSITFNYMLSSDWYQYRFLYKWLTMNGDDNNLATEDLDKSLLDISVYVLSEFQKPLWRIDFIGCFLQSLGSVDFNYQDGATNIQHSFTIQYATYSFEGLID